MFLSLRERETAARIGRLGGLRLAAAGVFPVSLQRATHIPLFVHLLAMLWWKYGKPAVCPTPSCGIQTLKLGSLWTLLWAKRNKKEKHGKTPLSSLLLN